MKCFYHRDNDGVFSAACVAAFSTQTQDEAREFVSINYNEPFPFDTIGAHEQVWIVDYSIEPDEMRRLLGITENVHWIDHHKTAIDKYKDFNTQIRGVRQDGLAACHLTWLYFHGVGEDLPRAIELVADYDIWAFQYGEETRFFHAGIQLRDVTPTSAYLARLLSATDDEVAQAMDIGDVISDGKIVERYRQKNFASIEAEWSFPVEFEGHKSAAGFNAKELPWQNGG